MEAKGRKLLKVVSILLIIFGILAVVVDLISLLGVFSIITMQGNPELLNQLPEESRLAIQTASVPLTVVSIIIVMAHAIISIIAGIKGNKHCGEPTYADGCIKLGMALIILNVISTFISIISGSGIVSLLVSFLVSLILPGLYIYGWYLNKQSV